MSLRRDYSACTPDLAAFYGSALLERRIGASLSPGLEPMQRPNLSMFSPHTMHLPLKREPTSPSSTPALSSPSSTAHSAPSPEEALSPLPATPPEERTEQEATWQLIPYDVPWGEDFLDYQAGILPGPEGSCLFLRSPTPVEKRRAAQACEMCRERKAKCSGDRPACLRCIERGYDCEYASEAKRTAAPTRRKAVPSYEYRPYPQSKPGQRAQIAPTAGSTSLGTHNLTTPEQRTRRSPKHIVTTHGSLNTLTPVTNVVISEPLQAQSESNLSVACSVCDSQPKYSSDPGRSRQIHAPKPRRPSPAASFLATPENASTSAASHTASLSQESCIDYSVLQVQDSSYFVHPVNSSAQVHYAGYVEAVETQAASSTAYGLTSSSVQASEYPVCGLTVPDYSSFYGPPGNNFSSIAHALYYSYDITEQAVSSSYVY